MRDSLFSNVRLIVRVGWIDHWGACGIHFVAAGFDMWNGLPLYWAFFFINVFGWGFGFWIWIWAGIGVWNCV
jgi:hypothetical protein